MGKEALGQAVVPLLGPWGKWCVALLAKWQNQRSTWERGAGGVTLAAAEKTKQVGWEGLGCREPCGAVCCQNWEGLCGWKQLPLRLC